MRLVFWRTVFCDADGEIENEQSLHDWHEWFCNELWMNLLMMDSRLLLHRDSSEMQLGKRVTSTALVRNRIRHKKFFQAGDAVGIGPLGVREGDAIVLLQGYKHPFVARANARSRSWFTPWRKLGMEYRLVGPCYVHAILEWEKYHESIPEWEELTFV